MQGRRPSRQGVQVKARVQKGARPGQRGRVPHVLCAADTRRPKVRYPVGHGGRPVLGGRRVPGPRRGAREDTRRKAGGELHDPHAHRDTQHHTGHHGRPAGKVRCRSRDHQRAQRPAEARRHGVRAARPRPPVARAAERRVRPRRHGGRVQKVSRGGHTRAGGPRDPHGGRVDGARRKPGQPRKDRNVRRGGAQRQVDAAGDHIRGVRPGQHIARVHPPADRGAVRQGGAGRKDGQHIRRHIGQRDHEPWGHQVAGDGRAHNGRVQGPADIRPAQQGKARILVQPPAEHRRGQRRGVQALYHHQLSRPVRRRQGQPEPQARAYYGGGKERHTEHAARLPAAGHGQRRQADARHDDRRHARHVAHAERPRQAVCLRLPQKGGRTQRGQDGRVPGVHNVLQVCPRAADGQPAVQPEDEPPRVQARQGQGKRQGRQRVAQRPDTGAR